jgi:hypothetical protein
MSHFIKRCTTCDTIIAQCRCPAPNKKLTYGVCGRCKAKPEPIVNVGTIGHIDYDANRRTIADLQALCGRAFSILLKDFDKLRDSEGYGPSTLLRDLKKAQDGIQVKDITLLNEQLHKALSNTLETNKKYKKALEYISGFTHCAETEEDNIVYKKAIEALHEPQ